MMLLLSGVITGIATGLTLGGSIWNLGNLRIRSWQLLFAALLIQLLISSSDLSRTAFIQTYGVALFSASVVAVLAALATNAEISGVKLLFLGTALNGLAVISNNGRMPVDVAKLASLGLWEGAQQASFSNVEAMSKGSNWTFLGDVFVVPDFLPLRNVFSIGDILIFVGAVVFLYSAMRARSPRPAPLTVRAMTANVEYEVPDRLAIPQR